VTVRGPGGVSALGGIRGAVGAVAIVGAIGATAGCGDRARTNDFDVPPQWRVSQVHQIGSVADPDEALTRVGTVALGPGAELFVEQTEDAEVRVYGADGSYRGPIGRRGEGPGEIGGLQTLGVAGDSLWVLDQGNGRLTWFDLEGEFLSDEPWSPAPTYQGKASFNYAFPLRMRLRSDGGILAIPGVLQILQEGESAPPIYPPIVTLGLDAVIRDTVLDRTYRYAPVPTSPEVARRIFDGLSESLQNRYDSSPTVAVHLLLRRRCRAGSLPGPTHHPLAGVRDPPRRGVYADRMRHSRGRSRCPDPGWPAGTAVTVHAIATERSRRLTTATIPSMRGGRLVYISRMTQ